MAFQGPRIMLRALQVSIRNCLFLAGLCWVSGVGAFAEEAPSAVAPLMKLFQSGRLPAERQPQVVEMICKRGNAHDLRAIFDKILDPDAFSVTLRQSALVWLSDAVATRKIQPEGDLSGLKVLVVGPQAASNPPVRRAAIQFAATCQIASLSPALQELALDPNTPSDLKRSALEGLVLIGDPGSQEALVKLTADSQPLTLRIQAITGISSFDVVAAANAAAKLLESAEPNEDLPAILDGFFEQKTGSEALSKALEGRKLNPDVAKVLLRHMYSVGRSDAVLSNLLSTAAGIAVDPPLPTQEEVAKLVDLVLAQGNAARGEAVFRRKDVSCMKCHSVSRAGGQVGPELSAVGGSSPTDYIVNSILNPNLAVKEQYVTKVFELESGKVLIGVIVDRDLVRVNIRDVNGHLVSIPTADIEDEIDGPSLMPQGLTKFLTREEVIDLARFISELGKPGTPYALNQRPTIQRWRVLRDPPRELTDEVPHLEHVRQFILGSSESDWSPAYSRVGGDLPLAELVGTSENKVVVLKGEIEIRTAGDVTVTVDCSEKFQVWVDAQAFEDRNSFNVALPPGRHAVIVRVEVANAASSQLAVEVRPSEMSSAKFQLVEGY